MLNIVFDYGAYKCLKNNYSSLMRNKYCKMDVQKSRAPVLKGCLNQLSEKKNQFILNNQQSC